MIDCPSCKARVETSASACPHCGWRFNLADDPQPSVRPAARPKISAEVDMGLTIDRTASDERFKKGIQDSVPMILKPLETKATKVKVFLQTHGDLEEGQAMVLVTDGGTVDQAIQDAKNIVYAGGGLPPENHLDAIENLLKIIPWVADPRRARGAIVAFMTADTKPARSGRSAREIGEEILKRSLLLYLVCETTPTLKELCDAAGGMMCQITNNPDPAEMQMIASRVSASIAVTVASGGTRPMTVPVNQK